MIITLGRLMFQFNVLLYEGLFYIYIEKRISRNGNYTSNSQVNSSENIIMIIGLTCPVIVEHMRDLILTACLHPAITRCSLNVGPRSTMLTQRYHSIASTSILLRILISILDLESINHPAQSSTRSVNHPAHPS